MIQKAILTQCHEYYYYKDTNGYGMLLLLALTIDKELLSGKRSGEVVQLFQALLQLPAKSSLLFVGGTGSLFNLSLNTSLYGC